MSAFQAACVDSGVVVRARFVIWSVDLSASFALETRVKQARAFAQNLFQAASREPETSAKAAVTLRGIQKAELFIGWGDGKQLVPHGSNLLHRILRFGRTD